MSARVYEWTVTNTTTGRVAFDDKALDAAGSVRVHRLTDDILSGYHQGRLRIVPDPHESLPDQIPLVGFNPCQLPLPVRIIGQEATHPVGNALVDLPPISVPAGLGGRTAFLSADRRRRLFRVRNSGIHVLWFDIPVKL